MRQYNARFTLSALLLFLAFWYGCKTVKPWQRTYLNDESMQVGKKPVEKFSTEVHTYREGASGGGKAKASGGCGCN
jgi:hypothetical protein